MAHLATLAIIRGTKEYRMARHFIDGDTYPVKDQLKALGCRFDGTRRAWYTDDDSVAARAKALVQPHPLYNSPPPQDLGTADPAALAAQHGRQAVAGAKVVSFEVYGLAKGDDGKPNGSIRTVRGKRYVQVARTARRYVSRDWLEDMDLFGQEPGGHYQWDGVEVEPTAEEAAADRAAQDAKAAAARAKEEAAAKAKEEQAARLVAWEVAIVGLDCTACRPVGGETDTEDRLQISADGESRAVRIVLADGRTGWRQSVSGYDDYRTNYYLPADVARDARLALAESSGITPESATEWLSQYSGCYGADIRRAVVEADEPTKERLRQAAADLAAKKLAERREQEERDFRRLAEGAVAKLPIKPVAWELSLGDGLAAYCEALASRSYGGEHPRLEGASVTLSLSGEHYTSRGQLKAPVARQLPSELRLHNYCTVAVVTKRSDL